MTAEDKNSEVVCETLVTTDLALVAGEITTDFYVDIPELIRETIFVQFICNRGQL
jgi:S-adenosylmethionine synthetase